MTGGGRGFCSPWGRGAAFRRGIVQPYPGVPYAPYSEFGAMPYRSNAPWAAPFKPQITCEQKLNFLRSEAEAVKEQVKKIEARIGELETEGS